MRDVAPEMLGAIRVGLEQASTLLRLEDDTGRQIAIRDGQRNWGSYDNLHQGDNHQVRKLSINPGQTSTLRNLGDKAQHWIAVAGTSSVTIDGVTRDLRPGDQIFVPQGADPQIENTSTGMVEIIAVELDGELGGDIADARVATAEKAENQNEINNKNAA